MHTEYPTECPKRHCSNTVVIDICNWIERYYLINVKSSVINYLWYDVVFVICNQKLFVTFEEMINSIYHKIFSLQIKQLSFQLFLSFSKQNSLEFFSAFALEEFSYFNFFKKKRRWRNNYKSFKAVNLYEIFSFTPFPKKVTLWLVITM